jgi:cation:H+ antiporter
MLVALAFLAGLAALFFGADWLVRGAVGIAGRFRIPPLVIGLTIVGFGTSTPELLVSVQAALVGSPGIAIGNVVGSNTANILVILGLSAAVASIAARWEAMRGDLAWMMAAALVLVPMFWDGRLSRPEGVILFAGILAYVALALRRVGSAPETGEVPVPGWKSAGLTVLGLVVLMLGARLLVDSSIEIARWLGVSEAIIGLTIVAVGTSLPELATSVTAAARGEREIAIGNVVGSNIYNILAILGLTALIAPIPVEARFLVLDVPVMLAVSLLLVGVVFFLHNVSRLAGIGFLVLYALYVVSMAA